MDHFSGRATAHPLRRCVAGMSAALQEVEDLDPVFMSAGDKAAALSELAQLADRVQARRLAVMAAADDVAESAGCRDVAAWLQREHRRDRRTAAAEVRLAGALASRWPAVADGVRAGSVSLEQARVIIAGLDDLAAGLATERHECVDDLELSGAWVEDVLARATAHLIGCAAEHTPPELARLAQGLLTTVAPEAADELERRALERAERRAAAETRLRMRRRGDGCTDVHARISDLDAHRLETYLHAFTSPRSGARNDRAAGDHGSPVSPCFDPGTGRRIPHENRMGQAFCLLLERVDPDALGHHGGRATSLTVTIDHAALRDGVGHGAAGDPHREGVRISPGQARRLACTAGIAPVVLGGDSEPLDLGRTSRFFTAGQRRAHTVAHPVCEAGGCTIPAAWCDAHHKRRPWSRGGTTDRDDLALLCPWHHRRAHDPTFRTEWSETGVRFHRRT